MPVEQQPPQVLAMLLADTVLTDWATGKNTVQGIYQHLRAAAFPFTHPALTVYVMLAEGRGKTEVRLRLIDVDEEQAPLVELKAAVDFPNPFVAREIIFSQPKVVFPVPGEYRLQLFGAGELLLDRRLEVNPEEDRETP